MAKRERVKQTVIVKKSHPLVKNRQDAWKIAKKYADRMYTSRETTGTWRFRQRPPEDFVEGSILTEKKGDHVLVVWGDLKESE